MAPSADVPMDMRPNTRVTLTGEVIEVSASTPVAPSGLPKAQPTSGSSLPPVRPMSKGDSGIVRDHGPAPEEALAKKNRLAELVVVAILVAVAAIGGTIWWQHRPTPQTATVAYYKNFIKGDWKTLYDQSLLSDDEKKNIPDADSFAKQADLASSNPVLKLALDAMKQSVNTIKIGEPKANPDNIDKVDVPTSIQLTLMGKKFTLKGTAHMINNNGWKLNGEGGINEAIKQMIGTPEMSGGTAGG